MPKFFDRRLYHHGVHHLGVRWSAEKLSIRRSSSMEVSNRQAEYDAMLSDDFIFLGAGGEHWQ